MIFFNNIIRKFRSAIRIIKEFGILDGCVYLMEILLRKFPVKYLIPDKVKLFTGDNFYLI